jgi:hypothetical protein
MKKSKFLMGILGVLLVFGLVLAACDNLANLVGGGDGDETGGGQTGRLTVNNLTGDTQNAVIYQNASPTTAAGFTAATADGKMVAFDGYDEDHKTPFDMRMSDEDGEPVTFNKTGKYLVVVKGGAGTKFKADVQFTNGSATVDYKTMTLVTSLSGDGDGDTELEEYFNNTPASQGLDEPVSVDKLVAWVSGDEFSSLSDFTAVGGELYVNGKKVTSGSTMIQPNDTVRILAPARNDGDGDGDGDGDEGQAGRLTVNNLTGDFQNAAIYQNASPTTAAEFNAASAYEKMVAFDGYDEDHKTPFDMRMSDEDGEPVVFNKTGKYLVVVMSDDEGKFKADVQFTNGSATVDYNTMTLVTSLPGNSN